ncbi:hypothetical protein Q9966_013964 [Columba livia]|nr:hypothetical protein Q9966_013964 [Columba livia]
MIKKFDKKDEESGSGSNPFQHLEKSAVLQEARIFNETPINPRRCLHILTKILYLLNQGEHFGTTEATEAFFAMTRLFQSNDQTLRRMCYLTIKEMANISEDVIIVTSSLTKDMTGKEDVYRGPAIRALCRITDGTMLQAIERYMKQAIVDKVPSVSSSALVSSLHMMKISYDVVKRWINEAQEAASSDNVMVQVAMKHPSAVTACNLDLENLITDSNRSIATLAITTLLKTGSESSVDRLMKQISSFVSEISDEFKVVVVQAISALCQKYPRKHSVMMTFLSNMLRDDGGFEYKRAIVDCIISIIEENPESKESGLAHLCEFIEDCEHTVLATKILHLLGEEGPRTPSPSKYIRFIFNRVVLENEAVRAAAVSALAKFGAQNENLLPSILVLLQRCMMDSDDEVRDRATFYLNVLQQRQIALNAAYIFNGLTVSVPGMEKALHQYTLEPSDKPFDMKTVPLATAPIFEQKAEIPLVTSKPEKVAPSRQDIFQVACTFSCTMRFTVRDCDPNTGVPEEDGYDDEYVLEDLEVTVSDHIQKVLKPNFAAAWEEVGDDFEKEETFALSSIKTLDEAVNNIIKFLGMQPCERSDKVPENKNSHTLYLAGVYRGGCDVLVRSRLALGDGVTMQVTVRSKEETPVDVILASVG